MIKAGYWLLAILPGSHLPCSAYCFAPFFFRMPSLHTLSPSFSHAHTHAHAHTHTHTHTRTLTHTHTHTRTLTHAHPLTHSLTHSHTHSLTHSLTPSLTHSLTHMHTYHCYNSVGKKKLFVQVRALQVLGVTVWIDEEMMTGRIQQKMTEGIDDSESVLVFITEEYILKVRWSSSPSPHTFLCRLCISLCISMFLCV